MRSQKRWLEVPNIQDVARLAGVSTATVSRVINNRGYVSDLTKRKVLGIIEELDYVPNDNAKGETHQIGIITPSFTPIIINFVCAFTLIAEKNGFNITLFITNGDAKKELVALKCLNGSN